MLADPDAPAMARIVPAVGRAAAHRRRRLLADLATAHYTAAALGERVAGLPDWPGPRTGDGWYAVGVVADRADGTDRRVWLQPATGRVRLQAPELPAPPVQGRRWFDGD